MKLIRITGCIFIIAFNIRFTYSQTVHITLKDAVQNAYKYSPTVVKDQYLIQSEESIIRAGYGSLLPNLTFSTGVSRTNQVSPPGIVLNTNGTPTNSSGNINNTYNSYNLTLRSDVTLFNGFNNYDQINVDKLTKIKYEREVQAAKQDITILVLSNYIAVLKDMEVVKIDSASLEDARTQLESSKIFVEVGTKTIGDVYKQQVVVAQDELALEQARNNVNKSLSDLAYNSVLPQNRIYEVDTNEFNHNLANSDLENYVALNSNSEALVSNALHNRYDYKASQENISILETNVEMARSSLIFPTLTGFGEYQLAAQHIGDLSNSRVFTLGLTLSYPIFEGFSLENQKEQAIINLNSANVDVRNLSEQITLNIQKSIYDLKSLLKQIEITDASLQAAEQDRYLAEESYKVGRGTLLEVNTAAVNYNNQLITKSNLIYDFIFAQKQLEYYQGLLKY